LLGSVARPVQRLNSSASYGQAALFSVMPRLRALIGDVEIDGVKIRPVDLYVSKGYRQPGIVLVGDAFGTSCPAAGTGCNKVFTDVVRLCKTHIPRWMATAGMESDKIATFYDDEVKIACESFCTDKAYYLRSFCTDDGLAWRARRIAKFLAHLGKGAAPERRASLDQACGTSRCSGAQRRRLINSRASLIGDPFFGRLYVSER